MLLGLLGLGVRLAWVIAQRRHLPFPLSDATKYAGMANLVAQGRWFIDPIRLTESADHSPLYTVYLSVVGFVRDGHATAFQLMLWSCLLGAATVVVVGLAGRAIGGPRVEVIAAAIAAVNPAMWVYDGLLLSESLAILCVAAVILCAYRLWRAPSLGRVLWLGLWCGLATLARSELLLTVPLVLLPLTLRAVGATWRRRLTWLVAGCLLASVVLTPWIAYNRSRFREPVLLSTNFGRTMAAAKCQGGYHGQFLGAQDYACLRVIEQGFTPDLDESEQDRIYRSAAQDYVLDHPGRTVVAVAASWGRIFGVYRPTQELSYPYTRQTRGAFVAWLVVLSFYVLFPAAVVGAVVLHRRRVPIYPLLAMWLIILFSITVTFAQVRYRAIGEPTLVLLTAVALDALLRRLRPAPVPALADAEGAPPGQERVDVPGRR